MNSRDFFALHPVFTSSQFAEFLRQRQSRSVNTRNSLLRHHERRGHITRIRRGLYTTLTAMRTCQTCADPFAIAAAAAPDAVLALGSAAAFWSAKTCEGRQVWFYTRTACRTFRFRDVTFSPVRPSLWGSEEVTVDRHGIMLRVATAERAVADLLDRLEFAGGWAAACRTLRDVQGLDVERLVTYVLRLGRAAAAAKVGYFLESRAEPLTDVQRCKLLAAAPRSPHYVDGRRPGGRYVRRWNLIVPAVA